MIRTAMAINNGERTLLETQKVHAFIDDIAAARTQEVPAGVTDFRGLIRSQNLIAHRATQQVHAMALHVVQE